jgi:hypothetical protein
MILDKTKLNKRYVFMKIFKFSNAGSYLLLLTILLINNGCQKDVVLTREYPRLAIFNEVGQDESGITFKAEILSDGDMPIVEKGFVWGTSNKPELYGSKIVVHNACQLVKFEAKAIVDFGKSRIYNVKSFVKTQDRIVYSKGIQFESDFTSPVPEIIDFYPKMGSWDDTIKISGKNFSYIMYTTQVFLGNVDAIICSCNDSVIFAKIPQKDNDKTVSIKVQIANRMSSPSPGFTYILPKLENFNHQKGTYNGTKH